MVCGKLACVLRTSEPVAVAFGEALSGGSNTTGPRARDRFRFSPSEATHPNPPALRGLSGVTLRGGLASLHS